MGHRAADEPPGWSLAWSDEFDGPAGSPVDPGSWTSGAWPTSTGGTRWKAERPQARHSGGSTNQRSDSKSSDRPGGAGVSPSGGAGRAASSRRACSR
jgi:hypothetical protein